MKIDIITAVPEILKGPFDTSVIKKGLEKNIVEINIHNLRNYSKNNYKSVDDYQYGGGSGMVLSIEPIDNCINYLKKNTEYDEIIYMAPDGEKLSQQLCNKLSCLKNIIILCGHYKGIDQRIRDHLVSMEISIGDFVLTGGELPAAILADGIIRLLPGVLGNEMSALTDSFQDNLIAPPLYTKPKIYKDWEVPGVLLSGNQKNIEDWRNKKAIELTHKKRPKLL
ncbi:MAG: tRNA (guanosine(37)-N1)-methyltransferase TrmD [Bacteroidetes bacterium MED-G13]|nr:MAG: tRNA (guanosine(37)-N1)-methyltransferase TrmD [Bacteroidetes bacterium MED-G13]|tara:strand:+ start:5623 stop:6294 length:672 start_codon:yes stop_codon:yes gene_type:complete